MEKRIRKNKKAAAVYHRKLLLRIKCREIFDRLRPMILAFGITMAIFILIAGWAVVGYRCRMTVEPQERAAVVCDLRAGYGRVRVMDWEIELGRLFGGGKEDQ